MNALLVLCAALGAAAPADPPAPTALPIRRFALVAGVNDGGPERVPLRYARSDAERVAQVLERLGGVAAADRILLLDPDGAALRSAFRDVEARIRAARDTHRAELVLYYSGHSDEQGLLVKGNRVPFPEVRRWLEAVPAQVRIAIVDSCSSGALTRRKGGQRAPPFLVDTSSAVKGHAILTSSAEDEASQESDRIGASFFTHFLVTGLRGAADTSQDGKVTVSEAYQYAFSETLARTERTRSGAQHPAYDIQLVGSGDVVLTDLRGTEAALVFPEKASGRYFVRDGEGRLVAELRKLPGRPIELGVEPGTYKLVRDDGDRLAETRLVVASGARALVPTEGLTTLTREATARRGGRDDLALVPIDVSVFPPLSLNGERSALNYFQLGMFGARATSLRGFGLAPVLWADEDVGGMQLGGLWASAGGHVDGAQLSGIAGMGGSFRGAQVGGIAAYAREHVEGTQISGIGGLAGSLHGIQVGGIVNALRGDLTGAQLGGLANWAGGGGLGAQVSGFANFAGAFQGVQVSGFVNVADAFEGGQLSVVNVAGALRGAQLGVVNVSSGGVRGFQVGVVNVSRQVDGLPLGLVNVVRDGWHRVLVVSDEDGTPALGWAGGNDWFHTTLEASVRRTADGSRGWAAFGPGVHLRYDRMGIDLDLLAAHELARSEPYAVVTLRGLASLPITSGVSFVAGPTLNTLFARDAASAPPVGGALGSLKPSGDAARAWVGLQAGVRL